ncbi:sugar phosphate isomerase/epimerase family protein [Bremerella sp. T1]|uniref:sugar phosphate isomerase/epimerase family protein n=1 Tax=Bremerella sp. TYQ1 TaxID=3119568 RepID=UPI001CCA8891|nr:sugar phosphate isomerase/epimerase family protein [Bremerella volcania]UBM34957.1 sugar phosphate isomerase/epimerase [Bremerella volcania]
MIRISVQLRSLRQPFRKALETAGQLGADAVEIDLRNELRPEELTQTGIRHLKKIMSDYNLKIASVAFPTRRGYNVLDDLDRRVAATKSAMDAAYQLGAKVLVNHIGGIDEELTAETNTRLLEVLHDLARHADTCGVTFAAKTGQVDGVVLRKFLDQLPEGALGVDFDPGALIINGFSAEESYQALAKYVANVRGKDGVKDLARGRGIEVPLGRGTVDFPLLIASLEEARYKGYICVEREHPEHPVQEVSDGLEFLRNVQIP